MVHRTARCGLRVTRGQARRCFGLLRSAGDVWCAVLQLNRWRRQRGARPLAGYQELCRELASAGPGTFGELDTTGARSVLRRYSDAWFAAAKRRAAGDMAARFPRRRRALVPIRWYHGTFTLDGRVLRLPAAQGCPPLVIRLDRDVPYPAGQVRSVTLGYADGRLYIDVTAEVPVATYPEGLAPDPGRVAGVDLGVIHPFAVAGPAGAGLLVSGRAIRAEHRQHLRDQKARRRAAARRAPLASSRPSAHLAARSRPASDPRCDPTARSTASSFRDTRSRARTRAPAGAAATNGAAISRSPLTRNPRARPQTPTRPSPPGQCATQTGLCHLEHAKQGNSSNPRPRWSPSAWMAAVA